MTSSTSFEFPTDKPITDRPTRRRRFARFLLAICIGVAGTLAWQSYGDATKQIIATRAPELGWSPESKQMIASMYLCRVKGGSDGRFRRDSLRISFFGAGRRLRPAKP